MSYHHNPKPEPSWLEQDLAGMPIWGHLLIGVATFGIYFLILPFILLFNEVGKASDRASNWFFDKVFSFVWRLVKLPFQLLGRLLR